MIFLCGPLRISAISALKGYFSAEIAEIRRGPQREASLYELISGLDGSRRFENVASALFN